MPKLRHSGEVYKGFALRKLRHSATLVDMELLDKERTPQPVLKQALEVYYNLPAEVRHNHKFCWILSKETMERLAGRELTDEEMDGTYWPPSPSGSSWGPWLAGKPVRRDDNAKGFSYEVPPSRYMPLKFDTVDL